MTNAEKYIAKLTLEKLASLVRRGEDCITCPAEEFCCAHSNENCEIVFTEWGKMEAAE